MLTSIPVTLAHTQTHKSEVTVFLKIWNLMRTRNRKKRESGCLSFSLFNVAYFFPNVSKQVQLGGRHKEGKKIKQLKMEKKKPDTLHGAMDEKREGEWTSQPVAKVSKCYLLLKSFFWSQGARSRVPRHPPNPHDASFLNPGPTNAAPNSARSPGRCFPGMSA